jgi:hypothetical protein
VVLLIQDTTEVDLSHHPKTEGLGQIGNERGRGLYLQTALAVLPKTGEVVDCAMLCWLMAQRPEKLAQRLGNQVRLLQENEVPAAPKVDPTSDIAIDPLQIFAWGPFNLLGGACDSCRNLNAVLCSPGPRRVIPFVVEPIRGIDRLGDPVDHHIRQKLVSGEMPVQVSSWWISPHIPFLDDPGGQSCGRIIESIG